MYHGFVPLSPPPKNAALNMKMMDLPCIQNQATQQQTHQPKPNQKFPPTKTPAPKLNPLPTPTKQTTSTF